MAQKRVSVHQLASEAGLELDDTLVLLWDAGFDQITGPGDFLARGEANRARRALGLATRRELGSPHYWLQELHLDAAGFIDLLESLGIREPLEGTRLRKKAITRLQAEKRRRGILHRDSPPLAAQPIESVPSFTWEQIGRQRDLTYLSIDDVEAIHQALVDDFQNTNDPIEPAGVRSQQLLGSAVHRPMTSIDHILKYPTVEMAAAALLHALVHDHPFHNGNKRTALVAMIVFLDENGLTLTCREDELFKLVLQLAQHSLVVGLHSELADGESLAIARWLSSRSRWIEKGDRPIPWRRFRRLLTNHGCSIEHVAGPGNWIRISRTVARGKTILGRPRTQTLLTQLHIMNDGRDLDRGAVKSTRAALELDEDHGVDSSAFYDGDTVSPSEFIVRYRKTLRRLASL